MKNNFFLVYLNFFCLFFRNIYLRNEKLKIGNFGIEYLLQQEIKLFGNKNINDTERLFEIVKEELLRKNRGNFIFIKDITTHQRKLLYELLEKKGYKRTELFRHYSY